MEGGVDREGDVVVSLTNAQVTAILRGLGWRVRTTGERTQVITHFQQGWALGAKLTADGVVGPKTAAALTASEKRRRAGQPTASPHFSFSEFACQCHGRYADCPQIWVRRELLESLEVLRARFYPGGLTVASGCRCARHNKAVGGVSTSQHLFGAACDIPYTKACTSSTLARLRIFAGIGRSGHTSQVRHVDRRDIYGHNTTGGGLRQPTQWVYAT